MKLLKPFFLSLLLHTSILGSITFFSGAKKQSPLPKPLENKPFKMKLNFKEVLQKAKAKAKAKAKKTSNEKKLLNKTKKIEFKNKKVTELKKPEKKKKPQMEKKAEDKKEIKNLTSFRPSIVSKLKGFIKGKIPYPYAAILKNMEGEVHYTLTLSPKGETSHYKMTQSSGYNLLDQTVREFFLKNPLKGKMAFNDQQDRPLTISDHIQFKIEDL